MSASLTTAEAAAITNARACGPIFISQPYTLYSEENHRVWRQLYARMAPQWKRYANAHFPQGIRALSLDPQRVQCLEDVNRFLQPLTGF